MFKESIEIIKVHKLATFQRDKDSVLSTAIKINNQKALGEKVRDYSNYFKENIHLLDLDDILILRRLKVY